MRDLSIILALYFTFTRSTSIEFSVLSKCDFPFKCKLSALSFHNYVAMHYYYL